MCSLSQGESKNSGGYVQFHPVVSVVSAGDSPNNLDFRYIVRFDPVVSAGNSPNNLDFLIYAFVLTL